MDDEMIQCPECDVRFQVVWCNDGWSKPEYCPMCGCEMDYQKAVEAEEG
jgi:hypothetical protein